MELVQRLELADEVLAAFDRLPRATAAALSRALVLLPGPMRGLATRSMRTSMGARSLLDSTWPSRSVSSPSTPTYSCASRERRSLGRR
jgi:hypothetical protein